ncbi:hypothetical protein PACID_18750 [Acidipropionibacterium acidipropionici ATCC 4875]|uniref:Uncharacterized protein n=1 Tax=Acidipropionibacterium acidipropionici (strain ATCC 4875 / DSM 20272 / JCM 6432 / NBRC 12425 / NCIMB 8070 / 4) TaxID=1171373 RepID=K7S4Y4_ACIA4|nr:hypothetical protein [Acidipropionibacterium acidipropionici]AFV89677.1 hypothetical protein PACID_18750 [Acidipropionibacterium acidipropionici ATCC 4875]
MSNGRPDRAALDALTHGLSKATVTDPVIAGTTSTAGAAGNTSKTKFTIRIDPDLLGRARAAYLTHGIPAGYHSLSDWIADAIHTAVTEAEDTAGRLEPLGTGVIPRGPLPHTDRPLTHLNGEQS